MIIVHLITQDDQPYGSRRLCCERCGEYGRLGNGTHKYTDNRRAYNSGELPDDHVTCASIGHDPSKADTGG